MPDERMDMISSAIRGQAEQQSRKIIEKAAMQRDTELARYKEQVIDDLYDKVQSATAEIRHGMLHDISNAEQEAYHALMRRRGEMTAAVFEAVEQRLRDYASTEAYAARLLAEIEELGNSAYDHRFSVLSLRECDLKLEPRISAVLPGCTVKADAAVDIGGFILENTAAGIRVDNRLETRLLEQRPWFLQMCSLRVQ